MHKEPNPDNDVEVLETDSEPEEENWFIIFISIKLSFIVISPISINSITHIHIILF